MVEKLAKTAGKFAKPMAGLMLGGIGGLLMVLNSSYVAVGVNPSSQIFGICIGLVMCIVAPILIIPAPHDE